MAKSSFIQKFRLGAKLLANLLLAFLIKVFDAGGKVVAISFLGVFALFWLYVFQHRDILFVHDALNYWQARYSFVVDERFSLLNYDSPLRGYLFPFLLLALQWQANILGVNSQLLFFTYSALFFAGLAFYLLPWFFKVTFRWEAPLVKRVLFSALLFLFWRGHFLYPLTDFPALAFFLLSLGISVAVWNKEKKPLWAALAGLAMGAAINIRPIYQASLFVLLLLPFIGWRKAGRKEAFLGLVSFFWGIGTVLFPQFCINRLHFQANSPLVLSTYIENDNVYEIQLFWGLKTQKYETNIGDDYPFASVVYRDPLADKIPQRFLRDKTILGYLNIICSYPLEIAVSYFRHFFNGLDIFFSTPYVKKIHANHFWLSCGNYLIWFCVSYYYLVCKNVKMSAFSTVAFLSILGPVLLSVPLVVEVRFFLPLHLLAYGIVSYGINYKEMFSQIFASKFHFVKFVCSLGIWMLVCFTLSASTIEQLQ